MPMKAFQILLALLITASASAQSTPGWVTLFDGSNLDAFNRTGNANWEIVDKVVQANMGNGLLVTKANYADFELKVEFWVDDDANSGVFIRCSNPQSITQSNAYEVNI